MNRTQNLMHARQAVAFVRQQLKGAANWDQYAGGQSYERCRLADGDDCERYFNDLDRRVYLGVRKGPAWQIESGGTTLAILATIADLARQHGAGNCREFSAVAFMYLVRTAARPLDWMGLDADHAFVVIGRVGDENEPESWGPDAVICDAWASGVTDLSSTVYPAEEFRQKMGRLAGFTRVRSNFRLG